MDTPRARSFLVASAVGACNQCGDPIRVGEMYFPTTAKQYHIDAPEGFVRVPVTYCLGCVDWEEVK